MQKSIFEGINKRLIILYFLLLFIVPVRGEELAIKLQRYKEQAELILNSPEEGMLLQQGLELARASKNIEEELYFLNHLTRNAYNRWETDSVPYWAEQGIELAQKHQHHSDMIDMMSLLCLRHLFLDKFDIASDIAKRMFEIGKTFQLPAGMIASYEAMGILYRQTSKPTQALASYHDGLDYLRKTRLRPSQEMQFLSYIIEMQLSQGAVDEVFPYIENYGELLTNFEEGKYEHLSSIPVDRCKKLLHCFYTDYYTQRLDYEKAKEHYDISSQFDEVDDVYVNYLFGMNTISYHQYVTKNYDLALKGIEEIVQEEDRPEIMFRKAEILSEMGKHRTANKTLRELIHLKDSINDFQLHSQLNEMRSLLDLTKLERDKKELQVNKAALRFKLIALSFAIVVVILVFVMITLYRTARVKNILKRSEQELRAAKERAEESNRLKTIFIQNMSHEIRTPLNAIVGFSSILAEMPSQAPQFAPIIEENSNLLLKLVDDLLNISAIEAKNHTSLQYETIRLHDVCKSSLSSVSPMLKKHVKLVLDGEPDSLKMDSDPVRLQQVLSNLLINAIKYTEEGQITLSYKQKNDTTVAIVVKDTGIGVPVERQRDVFERFVKLDDFKQGTGLGLYICKTIVEAMDGQVYMDAGYTEGAAFVVELPLHCPHSV